MGANSMRIFASILALALGVAFAAPAFAGNLAAAKTEADCKKAGGVWDATMKMCSEKKM
jgi:hypothetical protein